MLYRLCSVCGSKVPYGTKCQCELTKDKERYKMYQSKRDDTKEQSFYKSKAWINFRDSISTHQFNMDLIDWYEHKEHIADAETYHHIIELKDDWSLRLTDGNVIGLTQQHHMQVHALMNKSEKDKRKIQKYLKKILYAFEQEFYNTPGE